MKGSTIKKIGAAMVGVPIMVLLISIAWYVGETAGLASIGFIMFCFSGFCLYEYGQILQEDDE